jgi:hypothetical protein
MLKYLQLRPWTRAIGACLFAVRTLAEESEYGRISNGGVISITRRGGHGCGATRTLW